MQAVQTADRNRSTAALVSTAIGQVLVFGTVLPWHADVGEPPRDPLPRAWQEHYRVLKEQAREWAQLRESYPDAMLCVAGDLNMSLGGPRFYGTRQGRELLQRAMAGAGLDCATSFDRIPAGLLQHPCIDHVLLPAEFAGASRVVCAWEGQVAGGLKLSDHSGLAVEL
jgi:hypothetical protein